MVVPCFPILSLSSEVFVFSEVSENIFRTNVDDVSRKSPRVSGLVMVPRDTLGSHQKAGTYIFIWVLLFAT
ncbi:hypothetical protein JTE90_025408 [Oedothorax gibbosus]|uniref:Uncharacterized protein n=1 Tax=Oedothorax gibbosus TaxID=931172 RepID=A0AAV6UIZ5_9ARAC|nr:hypothetical protein JTE90_025408 [Oedothorax gibbosus]